MKKCLPKCGKSSDPKPEPLKQLDTEMTKTCFKCNTQQSVAKEATVFVCTSCHTVNRLATPEVSGEALPVSPKTPQSMPELIALRRINSSTFVALDTNQNERTDVSNTPPTVIPSDQASVNSIGACSICLDAPGDMIFLQCNHGGFCEACARHIAGNNAVGGAFCVKCRSPIEKVVRIVELDKDLVKAVPVEVQTDGTDSNKQPPKVPPPRGFNKAKKR
jgi:hypothetical protein